MTDAEKLRGLARRIDRACRRADSLPTDLHWSDADLLRSIATTIELLETKSQKLATAVSDALAAHKG